MQVYMIRAVIFDWGDTIMEDLPSKAGPMAEWDVVEETPGIRQVLESLQGQVTIVLATNAAESGEKKIRQALRRVGLDGYFDAIYSAKELGVSKPDRQFFQSILGFHEFHPDQVLMVGDDLTNDVLGASRAGLRSIWLRRDDTQVLEQPYFDGEITHFDQWDSCYSLIQTEQFPSFAQINLLWQEYPTSPGLSRHVHLVGITAYILAQMLVDKGIRVSPILAHRGGLLHDLDKKVWREAGITHGEMGAMIAEKAGFHEVAEIIRRHQVFTPLKPSTIPDTWEQKLVYLADKFIEKDRFVGLEERFVHLRNRYPDSAGLFDQVQPVAKLMEEELHKALGIRQDELYSVLSRDLLRFQPK
jgi:putative hydrolase of the HAD superfamily